MKTSEPPLDAARATSSHASAVRALPTNGTAREQELGSAWARTPLAATVRATLQPVVIPMLHALYAVDTEGMERLRDLRGGVIFTANHHHHLDAAQIVAAMPAAWRRRLLVVAAADTIFASPLRGAISALLGNAIPLERDGSVRHSLGQLVDLLAAGWSLLIFPEGRLTVGGPLRHFKGGTALLALRSAAQVVPLWLGLERPGLWEGRARRGRLRLRMGAPQTLSPDLDHDEAADRLEAAVRALAPTEREQRVTLRP
jgi:1-acyl-sn-glycerol-3-phosphate acyltransferase